MKINRMPTVMALLVFSWIIAIFGLVGGGYLIVLRYNNVKSLAIAFSILLGGLLLATIIRMVGNVGQMFFDLKDFLFNILKALFQETTSLSKGLQDLKTQLQTQTTTLSGDLQTLKNSLEELSCDSEDISQNIYQIKNFFEEMEATNQDLKTQLQAQTTTLSNNLQALHQETTSFSKGLQALHQDLKTQVQAQTTTLSNNLQALDQDLKTQLQAQKSTLEQISCDSKDINQNIHQIRTFFEQIERHLDLKK